MKAEYTLDTFL